MRRLLLIALLLGLAPPLSACEKSLRWSEDPPYSMRLPDGRIGGLDVELAQELLRRVGCRARLVEMPFARALLELEAGRLDLLPGTFPRPERRVYAHFSQPLLLGRNLLFLRQEALGTLPAGAGLRQLVQQGLRLGVQKGVVYSPEYAELMRDPALSARLYVVPQQPSLWRMLNLGRIDAVIADEFTARHQLAQLGLRERIAASALVVSAEPSAHALSKRSNALDFLNRYDAALRSMVADGSYQALLQRYGAQR